jgi:YjbE family integral membrane protein
MEAVEVESGFFSVMPVLAAFVVDFELAELFTLAFWTALWKIILANIVLSGDNAVVIAMASRNLSEKYRSRAILFGSAGAVLLRLVFCAVIGVLLGIPYLKLVGGALLLWIGIKLAAGEDDDADIKAHDGLWAAIWTIVVADAVMSLDNAIAIAAAANGNFVLITAGLLISIPIIVFGATVISKLLDRLPWLGMIGAGLIGWIAGEVMADDDSVAGLIAGAGVPHAEIVCAVAGAVLVLLLGLVIGKLRHRRSSQT